MQALYLIRQSNSFIGTETNRPSRCCSRVCEFQLAEVWQCRLDRGDAHTTRHTSSELHQTNFPSPPESQPLHNHITAMFLITTHYVLGPTQSPPLSETSQINNGIAMIAYLVCLINAMVCRHCAPRSLLINSAGCRILWYH